MEIVNYFIAFIIGVFFILIVFFIDATIKDKKPINKVHFYVARDNDGELCLYFGKPIRCGNKFMITSTSNTIFLGNKIENYGLNPCDYDNFKWEDEPVEVFLNLKD